MNKLKAMNDLKSLSLSDFIQAGFYISVDTVPILHNRADISKKIPNLTRNINERLLPNQKKGGQNLTAYFDKHLRK